MTVKAGILARTGVRTEDETRRMMRRLQQQRRAEYDADRVLVKDADGGTELAVSTTATKFFHQLGRVPKFFRVCMADADVRVWWTAQTAESITLDASGNANVSVEVF